jgi:hypothetical protein
VPHCGPISHRDPSDSVQTRMATRCRLALSRSADQPISRSANQPKDFIRIMLKEDSP